LRFYPHRALYNFGGTWLDVDTIALASLRSLVHEQNARGKLLTVWQRSFTRAVDLGVIMVVPQHPVFKRWLLHLHASMDRQVGGTLR
jgi:mannosyltransferase OCH1-like enzyme